MIAKDEERLSGCKREKYEHAFRLFLKAQETVRNEHESFSSNQRALDDLYQEKHSLPEKIEAELTDKVQKQVEQQMKQLVSNETAVYNGKSLQIQQDKKHLQLLRSQYQAQLDQTEAKQNMLESSLNSMRDSIYEPNQEMLFYQTQAKEKYQQLMSESTVQNVKNCHDKIKQNVPDLDDRIEQHSTKFTPESLTQTADSLLKNPLTAVVTFNKLNSNTLTGFLGAVGKALLVAANFLKKIVFPPNSVFQKFGKHRLLFRCIYTVLIILLLLWLFEALSVYIAGAVGILLALVILATFLVLGAFLYRQFSLNYIIMRLSAAWMFAERSDYAIKMVAQHLMNCGMEEKKQEFERNRQSKIQAIQEQCEAAEQSVSEVSAQLTKADEKLAVCEGNLQELKKTYSEILQKIEQEDSPKLRRQIYEKNAEDLNQIKTEKGRQLEQQIASLEAEKNRLNQAVQNAEKQIERTKNDCKAIRDQWLKTEKNFLPNFALDQTYILGFMPASDGEPEPLFTIKHDGHSILLLYSQAAQFKVSSETIYNRIFQYVKKIIANELINNSFKMVRIHVIDPVYAGNFCETDGDLKVLIDNHILQVYGKESTAISVLKELSEKKREEHKSDITVANKTRWEKGEDIPVQYDILVLYMCKEMLKNKEITVLCNNSEKWGFLPIFIMEKESLKADELYRDRLIEIENNRLSYTLDVEIDLPDASADFNRFCRQESISPIIEEYQRATEKNSRF